MHRCRNGVPGKAFAAVFVLFLTATSVFGQTARDQQRTVTNGPATLQVAVRGGGAPIVFIPSLGRSVHDFDDLSLRLEKAGYQVILPEARGIGASTGPMDGITLHDLASDTAAVVEALGGRPAVIIGHAFGNQVARAVAVDRPSLVKEVILLSAGGLVPTPKEVDEKVVRVFDPALPSDDRFAAMGMVFFAPGHDPRVWRDGWFLNAAHAQRAAQKATPVKDWWAGGSAPILVLQGANDVISVPENAERLAKEFPDRVRVIPIPSAGHAMLPEQPEAIASAILNNLH